MESKPPNNPERFAPVVASAERLLTERVGARVSLGEPELLSEEGRRNVLLRCWNLAGGSPVSVIIKQVVADNFHPDALDSWDVQRFFNDWAGVQFLSDLGNAPAISPRFFGGDRSLGFFVIEDLGPHRSLVEPLLEGTARSATTALHTFARTLGRLHAVTIGHSDQYHTVCRELQPGAPVENKTSNDISENAAKLEGFMTTLGISPPVGLADELRLVHREMNEPGPFMAYIHGDPCPDNVFFVDGNMLIIDFEFARFGHALRDALYGRMPFPTCWCCNRLPPDVVSEMETEYRRELARGCPEAEDDRLFEKSMVHVCANWTLDALSWHLANSIEEEGTWGIAGVRPRILTRLETFLSLPAAGSQLPALHGTFNRMLDVLRRRWPDAEPLPLYPAFRQASPV